MLQVIRVIGNWCIAVLLRLYVALVVSTSKFQLRINEESAALMQTKQPVLLFFWHSRIILMPHLTHYYQPNAAAVVSTHGDGEYAANFLRLYGLGIIRGSSRRGSMQAIKQLSKALQQGVSIAIATDGPKGPRYQINSNAQKIAARMHIPLLLACYSTNRSIVLRTWDKFIVPLPFATIILEVLPPVYLDQETVEDNSLLCDMMREQVQRLDKETGLKTEY